MSSGKKILVGVGGGIAAYKTCELVRLLVREGSEVRVIPTASALAFVTALTFETLSRNPVPDPVSPPKRGGTEHIELADWAGLLVIAPATANLMARAAHGLADDLLTTLLLATRAPVLFCPAMNVNMWEHRATQYNVGRLRELGYHILEPESGELACGWEGKGRMAEPETIFRECLSLLSKWHPAEG